MCCYYFLLIITIIIAAAVADVDKSEPSFEQIHLSLGADATTQMTVTWVTQDEPQGQSSVVFHESGSSLEERIVGQWQPFKAGKEHTIYVHRVHLQNLNPGSTYHYKVSNNGIDSRKKYLFRTMTETIEPTLLLYGDMGTDYEYSLPFLIGEVERRNVDAIFHIGDLAYNLDDDEGRNGDKFMRRIEPIAANVPYQVVPGNHESSNNFTHYDNIFSMTDYLTKKGNNFYYSTNIGPMHIVMISPEFYFYPQYGVQQIQSQYNWLINDLREATKSENRKLRPWIIVMGHRPMYCSANKKHCTKEVYTTRNGYEGKFGLEEVLHEFAVDVYISGHAHIYERSYPVFREEIHANSSDPYHNAPSVIQITTGSAGCDEGLYRFQKERPAWSANRLRDYGYTRLIASFRQLTFQQITDQDGRVIDEFEVTKDGRRVMFKDPKMRKENYYDLNQMENTIARTVEKNYVRKGIFNPFYFNVL